MTTNPLTVNSSFKDNFKENSSDPALLNFSKHRKERKKETKNIERMIKNNNRSEGLTYVKRKVDMKLKCKKTDYTFNTTNT